MAAATTSNAGEDSVFPFHNDGNIMLRSSDGKDFQVYKEILLVASPLFRDMFTLPQPSDTTNLSPSTECPVIELEEDAETLEYILRLCYPIPSPPQLQSLPHIKQVLKASLKYDIEKVILLMKERFREVGRLSPKEMYAYACQLRLEKEARVAAEELRRTYKPRKCTGCSAVNEELALVNYCKVASSVFHSEMAGLPAKHFFNLVRFVTFGVETRFLESDKKVYGEHSGDPSPPTWPDHYLFESYPADVTLRSKDGEEYPAHRMILSMALQDGVMPGPLHIAPTAAPDAVSAPQELAVVDMDVDGTTLSKLIKLCYDFDISGSYSLEEDGKLWHAITKYGRAKIAEAVRRRWMSHLTKSPLRVFFIAMSRGWLDDARNAALYIYECCSLKAYEYVVEMESCPAKMYHCLLQRLNSYVETDIKAEFPPLIASPSRDNGVRVPDTLCPSCGIPTGANVMHKTAAFPLWKMYIKCTQAWNEGYSKGCVDGRYRKHSSSQQAKVLPGQPCAICLRPQMSETESKEFAQILRDSENWAQERHKNIMATHTEWSSA
ncbi:hypothetical protein K474DRAFT_1697669 [Panus rudis PR-1116 ss-1]|nr:hypothetical protein K474DRAFT_1697669 [Panus rudis PR-1116 ss-1]